MILNMPNSLYILFNRLFKNIISHILSLYTFISNMKLNLVIFLFIILLIQTSCTCHSSCQTCWGPLASQCLTCDSTSLTLSTSFECIGIPGQSMVLQIINSSWAGEGYLHSITMGGSIFYNANDLLWTATQPIQVLQSPGPLQKVQLDLANLPPNHYKLQFRAAGFLNYDNPGCYWNQINVNWQIDNYSPTINENYFTVVTLIDDQRLAFPLQYWNEVSSGPCMFYSLTDFTIVALLCSINCQTCSLTATNCTSCGVFGGQQYYLSQISLFTYICTYPCAISYFEYAGNYYCDACHASCFSCSGSIDYCTACNVASNYVSSYTNSSHCVDSCPSGQYIHNLTRCMPCEQSCLTCVTKATFCLSCGMSLGGQLYLNGSTCIFNCPAGKYQDNTLKVCKNCHTYCATCTGPANTNCLTCANGTIAGAAVLFYLAIGASTCDTICPQGQYINSATPNYCQQCSSLCVTCQGSPTTCLSCPSGFYLYLFTCRSECVPGTYADSITQHCLTCNPACSTCFASGTASCSSCKTDNGTGIVYYLEVGTTKCVQSCPPGQIQDTGNLCLACASQCSACSIATTNCTICSTISGVTIVYLQNETCVSTCSIGTYPQSGPTNNLCQSCDYSCSSCFGPLPTNCTGCTNYSNIVYYKDPTKTTCNISCPQGYFGFNPSNACSQCQTGCASCQLNASYCQSCKNVGSIAYYLINNRCVNVCPNSFYANGNLCSACDISCATCSGPLNTECISCANATISGNFTQFYLAIRTNTCNQTCPQGQYIDASFPNSCQQCSSLCISCQSSPNNCTNGQCPYGYFFYNNSCISVCFAGTYGDPVSWQCLSCNPACTICFSSGSSSCYRCKFDTNTNTSYYLQLGTTICSVNCPAGQIPGSANLCMACASQCAACSIIQTNCTNCSSVNGVLVYLQNGTCSFYCQNGTYGQTDTLNNVCLACNVACFTCFGPLATNCSSCRNTTGAVLTIFFKDPTSTLCSVTCPQGYVGISSTNACQQCQTGCVTCQGSTNTCQKCKIVGNSYYYFYNNSCLMICPDGTYKNNTDLTCYNCSYFTLNQQCIQQCPPGYVGVIKFQASVCEGCSTANCATYNEPFSIQTTVISSSKNLMHEVRLPSGLNRNCSAESISDGLQVMIVTKNRRLLATSIPLNILSVSISSDYSTITIITDSQVIDIPTASIGIQFRAGALVTPSGVLYTSLISSISLQNPVFIASYYQAYGKNINDHIQGIVLIVLSTFLLVISLFFGNQDTVNEMVVFVQSVQMVGLMRVKVFPIVLSAYNVLVGFSYYEMRYITNPLTYFIPGFTVHERASDPAILTYGSQNLISNFAPLLCFTSLLLLVALIFYFISKHNQAKIGTASLVTKAVIEYFIFIILYGCLLALVSLNNNILTNSNTLFISSILLSLAILISCFTYFVKNAKLIVQKEFYKITNFLKIICLVILGYRFDFAAICFNSFEIITIMVEVSRCGKAAPHPFLRFFERIAILVLINFCLFITEPRLLILGLGAVFAIIGCIKLYHLFKSIFNYLQKDNSDNVMDPKSEALKLQENSNNASQNFIFQETIFQKKGHNHLEKSLESINQMRQTAPTNLFPQHKRTEPFISDFHIREIIGNGEEIGARRKRKIKIIQQPKQVIEDKIADQMEKVEIIKIQPRLEMHKQQKTSFFEPELVSDNSDNIEIISIQ